MTEAMTQPLPVIDLQQQPGLQMLGAADAACEGDFCEIPDHHLQAVMNRKVDEDLI